MRIPGPASGRLPGGLVFLFLALRLGAQVTETPYTIAPGRFLLEMDAITVGIDRDQTQPRTYTALGLASAILSTGLTRDLDVQLGMQFFLRQKFRYPGNHDTDSGRGDVTVRMKWTFHRSAESGATAAVIPYVKLPSNTGGVGNNHVEGGFIVPWALRLGLGAELGAMARWDVLRNFANDGYESRWFTSGFVRQQLFGGIGAYAELSAGVSSASASTFAGGFGGGVTWDVSSALRLEYGLTRGLGNRATDWTNVVRVDWRF